MPNISEFASKVGHPLSNYLDHARSYQTSSSKERLTFLSGDPTVYQNFDFTMPEKGYQIFRKHVRVEGNHGYTLSSGNVGAREAILKLYKSKFTVGPNNVFINHGEHMGLVAVLQAFTNPGDEILVPEIGYPFFTDMCPAMNVKAVPYRLRKERNFEIDLEHAHSLINQRTQFIFVINPSNPMGSVFSEKHMKEILAFADENELPIVADEVYLRQSFPSHQHLSFGQVTEDVPVIALCGVEKVLSTPGWCTAWTVVFDKNGYLSQIVKNLAVICTIFLHTNRLTQEALPQIFETVGLFTHEKMESIQQSSKDLLQQLKQLKPLSDIFEPIQPSGTIYMSLLVPDFGKFKDISNDRELAKLIFEEQNVSIIPLSVFGESLQGLRVITCGKQELYKEFVQRMTEFVQKHRK